MFVDGSNWYHALKENGVPSLLELDYARISQKLAGSSREWLETRYYIGALQQQWNPVLYADQRRFLALISKDSPKVTTHLGRMEERSIKNDAAVEILAYLNDLDRRIDREVYQSLIRLCRKHKESRVLKEKAVDVQLAVDMVRMAERDEYNCAYLLSADGDFTPAVEGALALGKKVFAVSMNSCAQLAGIATSYIRLRKEWFSDCYRT